MGDVFLLALTAALNPTLLAATTVMLLLPNPKRLLLGYLLGALMTSTALGLLIVFHFEHTGAFSTAENGIAPGVEIGLGLLFIVLAMVIRGGARQRLAEHRAAKQAGKPAKGPPRWQRFLSKGSARDTFVVGALLTLPGASYLAGLAQMAKLDLSTTATALTVIAFNLIMMALLEVPTLGYFLAPDATPEAVDRFKAMLSRNGERILLIVFLVLGVALLARGVLTLAT